MPKINRIRIANVVYDGKYIVDQLIDTCDGQNVLINLANGGGKSVLTQLIMQPIIPNIKIHKRKMETYLSSKEPTFIMLEWLLDNTRQPTYFLTGIVMNKTVTEDNAARIKYFTFTNEYKSASVCDIKSINFISQENGIVKYKSYDSCLNILKDESKKNDKLNIFSIDEQKNYAHSLEEVGIFKDEWKILAKINEKEGGIDDLFDKCEKSDDIINQWILKTISDKLNNGDKLRNMFIDLMEEIVKHEDTIKEKEELDDFKLCVDKYIAEVSELLKNMDGQKSVYNELEDIYLKLLNYENKKNEEIDKLNEDIDKCNLEKEMLKYEEFSEEFYRAEVKLNEIIDKIEKNREDLVHEEEIEKETLNLLNILKAAKIYEEYKREKIEKEAAVFEIKKINEGLKDDDVRNIEYSLKCEYKNKIELFNENSENQKELFIKCDNENKKLTSELAENKKMNNDINSQIAVCCNNIKKFEEEQQKIWNELGLELIRNLNGQLVENEIEEIEKNYKELDEKYNKRIQEKYESIQKNDERIAHNQIEITNIEKQIELVIEELNDSQNQLKLFEKETEKIKNILSEFAIEENKLFEKDINLQELRRQRMLTIEKNDSNLIELDKKQEILYKLKDGGVHIDLEVGTVLDKNNIQYETGENYLKNQSQEFQKKILQKNPILPYAYIIFDEKDYNRVEELINNKVLNRITPIILSKDIGKDLKVQSGFVSFKDDIKFACLYNLKVLDNNLRSEYENELKIDIDELKERIVNGKNRITKLEKAIELIGNYQYDESSESKIKEMIISKIEERDNLKTLKINLITKNYEINRANKNINQEIIELNKNLTENTSKLNKFNDYLQKDKEYMVVLENNNELKMKLNEVESKEKEILKSIDESSLRRENIKIKIQEIERMLNDVNVKHSKIPEIETGVKLENELEELEKIYERITSKYSADINIYEEKIAKAIKIMEQKQGELNKYYKDLSEFYVNKVYSEDEEDFLSEKYDKISQSLKILKNEKNELDRNRVKFETDIEHIKNDLKRIGKIEPLQANLIKGNYKKRQLLIEEQMKKDFKSIKEIESELKTVNNKKNLAFKKIEVEPEYREIDITNMDFNNLPIDRLLNELIQLQKEYAGKRDRCNNTYNNINASYNNGKKVIQDVLKNMDPYKEEDEFSAYYYVYERVTNCLQTMEKVLQVLQITIANIEKDKENIKYYAFIQGKNIYSEMKKICEDSIVKMPGKTRRNPILEIELPKELDNFANERMDEYIEKCIKDLREECANAENVEQIIEKKVTERLSDRQLLNIIVNSETLIVRLYKLDISQQNSGLRKWEDIIVGNSGGEKLISCLIMILSLIKYTRSKIISQYGGEQEFETSEILVIDNPFGKMSSTHLLDGFTFILKNFNVQAICLSDISQSSITNQFSIVYQLSLKNAKYSDKIYLSQDNIIKNTDVMPNQLLEQAFVRTKEQLKLW